MLVWERRANKSKGEKWRNLEGKEENGVRMKEIYKNRKVERQN